MNIIPLVYHVDCDKKYGRYIASIHPRTFKRLALPVRIKDEFNSLAATYPWAYACQCKGNVKNIHMENYFFLRFQQLFRKYWDYAYGIPFLRFTGKVETFSPLFCDKNIFLLTFTPSVDLLYQYTYWEDAWMKQKEDSLLLFVKENFAQEEFSEIYTDTVAISDKIAGYYFLRSKMLDLLKQDSKIVL